jgi:precorrin-8X/cobalt-precorrin-8 methylmutase
MTQQLKPEEIEAESFRIIEAEAGDHGFPPEQWPVVRRLIHTSADFDYLTTLVISTDAVAKGIHALRRGRGIVTDTTMALAGISKPRLEQFGSGFTCLVADPVVAKSAARLGVTRSTLALRTAAANLDNGIFVIGNAPTALFELLRLVRHEGLRPDLVIGLPVGFVGAAESKEELLQTLPNYGIPYISNRGRKGGSNVAAAAVNALAILAAE